MSRRRRRPGGVIFGGAPLAAEEAVIRAFNPVGWYKFDEGAGTIITDYGSAGADLTGAGSGGAWVTGGHDSQGTRWWDAAQDLGIAGTDARTVLVVANPQTLAAGGFGVEWIGAGNGTRWTVRNNGAASTLRLEIAGEGFTETTLDNLADGTWVMAGGSMSAAGDALEDCALYENENAQSCTGTTLTINTVGDFQLGTLSGGGTVVDWIVGYCLVFDTELSAANIASIFTALQTIMAARGITLP